MNRQTLRDHVQPELHQDFDAVLDEWIRESGDRRVHSFLSHLVEWELVPLSLLEAVTRDVSTAEVVFDPEDRPAGTSEDALEEIDAVVPGASVPLGWDDDDVDSEAETVFDADGSELVASLSEPDTDVESATDVQPDEPDSELGEPDSTEVGEPPLPLRDDETLPASFRPSAAPTLVILLILAAALGAWLVLR